MQQRMLVVLNASQKLRFHKRHRTAAAAAALHRAQATKSSADTCELLLAPSCTAYTTGNALTSGQLTSAVTHTVASTVAGLMTGELGPVLLVSNWSDSTCSHIVPDLMPIHAQAPLHWQACVHALMPSLLTMRLCCTLRLHRCGAGACACRVAPCKQGRSPAGCRPRDPPRRDLGPPQLAGRRGQPHQEAALRWERAPGIAQRECCLARLR